MLELMKHEEEVEENICCDPKTAADSLPPPPPPLPSFDGRLNLSSFAFQQPVVSPRNHLPPKPPLLPTPSRTEEDKKRNSADGATTSSPPKRARASHGYAPPSTYAHLPPLPDRILPNLIVLFVGLNPGISTSTSGHAYAHPSNLFWKLLGSSGITPRRCHYSEDVNLPRLYALGNTNIVSRPSRTGSELSRKEMDEGVAALEEKIRVYRPEVVCLVGKSIWESVWRVRHGRSMRKEEFRYGWQEATENMGLSRRNEDGWTGARVFAATSTSGLAANLSPSEKERIWRELGRWVEERRRERESS